MDLSTLSPSARKDARAIIERCMVDRVFYVEHILGVKNRWAKTGEQDIYLASDEPLPSSDWTLEQVGVEPWQREVMETLDRGETKVSIRSAVGVGKTTLVSWLATHFVLFRDDVKVIVTSPSFNQLQDGIIPEVRKWRGRMDC